MPEKQELRPLSPAGHSGAPGLPPAPESAATAAPSPIVLRLTPSPGSTDFVQKMIDLAVADSRKKAADERQAFLDAARTPEGRMAFTTRIHSIFEFAAFSDAGFPGFLMLASDEEMCGQCGYLVPHGKPFLKQVSPDVRSCCMRCFRKRKG